MPRCPGAHRQSYVTTSLPPSLQLTPQTSRVPRQFVSRPKLLPLSGRDRMVRWFICVVLGTRIDVSSSDVDVAVGRSWSPGIICRGWFDPHSSPLPANMTRNARALSLTCDTPAAARFFFVSFSTAPTADEVPDGFAAIASSSYMRLREQFSWMKLGSKRRGCGTLRTQTHQHAECIPIASSQVDPDRAHVYRVAPSDAPEEKVSAVPPCGVRERPCVQQKDLGLLSQSL